MDHVSSQNKPVPLNFPSKDLLEGKKEFDIRKLHTYSLLDPVDKIMPSLDPKVNELATEKKETLNYQFEKDDLLFEVLEILDPKATTFRIKVYKASNFQMMTTCDVTDQQIKAQLARDKKTFLMTPQQREELSKYLIQNSFFDEQRQTLTFVQSAIDEED